MSYSINFVSPDGGEEVFSLCNIGAWGRFIDYVQALPPGFDSLRTLVRDGQVKDTLRLGGDLVMAQEQEPPPNDSPAWGVLEELIAAVGAGDDDETAYISQE